MPAEFVAGLKAGPYLWFHPAILGTGEGRSDEFRGGLASVQA